MLIVNAVSCLLLILAGSLTTDAQPTESHIGATHLRSTREFAEYVGRYPCSNGLLEQRVLLSSLHKILGKDYLSYREHMRISGCGPIEESEGYLLLDVSQEHVGGYTSLMFIRMSDGAVFLFWLKSTVADKRWSFYGQRPIPSPVSHLVESQLNTVWGHVARFKVSGDTVEIQLKDSGGQSNRR